MALQSQAELLHQLSPAPRDAGETFSLVLSQKGHSAWFLFPKALQSFCKLPLANMTLLDPTVTFHKEWDDQVSPIQAGSEA